MMNKCPFIQNTVGSESGLEDAMDLAFTAQAVLQGIVKLFVFQPYVEQQPYSGAQQYQSINRSLSVPLP